MSAVRDEDSTRWQLRNTNMVLLWTMHVGLHAATAWGYVPPPEIVAEIEFEWRTPRVSARAMRRNVRSVERGLRSLTER